MGKTVTTKGTGTVARDASSSSEIAAFLNNMADPDRDALESFVDPLQSDQ